VTRRKLTPWMIGVGGVTSLAGPLFGYEHLYTRPPGPDALPG